MTPPLIALKIVDPVGQLAAEDRRTLSRLNGAARSVLGAEWQQDEAVRNRICNAGRNWLHDQARLRRARGRSRSYQRDLAWVVLGSVSGRLVACLMSSAAKKEKLTFAQISERALSLNGRVGVAEPVRVFRKKNEKRILTEFGPKRAALQWMVRDVLLALMPPVQSEYAAKGKGRDAAICWLRDELNKRDHREVVLADVKGWFPSIRIDRVCSLLPLPRSVVRGIVFIGKEEKIELGSNILSLGMDMNRNLREGLPQGSFLSPVVAAHFMSAKLKELSCQWPAISYVDDIGVVADAKGDGEAIKHALKTSASAHLSGPTSFKRLDVIQMGSTSKKAYYLGYQLRVGIDGLIRITPTARSISKFMKRVSCRLRSAPYSQLSNAAHVMAASFKAAQAAWDFHEGAATNFETQLQAEVDAEKWRRAEIKSLKKGKSKTKIAGLAPFKAMMQGQKASFMT